MWTLKAGLCLAIAIDVCRLILRDAYPYVILNQLLRLLEGPGGRCLPGPRTNASDSSVPQSPDGICGTLREVYKINIDDCRLK